MRIVVAGLGSIGMRHLRNLRALEPGGELIVLRRDRAAGRPPEADALVTSLDDALASRPRAAFICGPSSTHVEQASRFVDAGVHVFVEKPLAAELAGARALVADAERAGVVLTVGYNLRFDPGLLAVRALLAGGAIGRVTSVRAEVGQYLPDWRPGSDYRASPSARAELGGGVALELSHELDYVRWLFGEITEMHAVGGRLSDLEIDVEDTLEAVVRFAGGAVGGIHLDMTQHAATRTLRVAGTTGTIVWDALAGTLSRYGAGARRWEHAEPLGADRNAMYRAAAADFLHSVRSGAPPRVSGRDGLAALELALALRDALREPAAR